MTTEALRGRTLEPELRLKLREAWAQLLDSSDAIADSITLSLFEREPDIYDRADPELRAEMRASSRQHIRRGLTILAGRPEAAQVVELWRETGRRRVRQGVPLESVLHAYTLGARVLWEALVERAHRPGGAHVDESVLLEAARTVWSNLDVQSAVLIDAYRRESARLQRRDLQRQHAVIEDLLTGRGSDPAYVDEARSALGVTVDDAIAVLVVLHDGDSAEHLGDVEDHLERTGTPVRWYVRTGVHVGLVSGELPADHELAAALSAVVPARTGVARATGGLAGVATAHLLASRAAETLGRRERRAVSVGERLPEVLLVGSPQVAPLLVEETLGALLAQPEAQRETLLTTLDALLRHDGSPTHAATELYCHRNTVIYRLKQIESLTGRSLTDPRDKLLLSLAVVAARHQ
ncbi:MAG: transcriptional regulator, CdaR [Nocardioides sp.]|nr:transcriptional regulator, CdaR [Nocardioides sp.]